jgi:hypothetical protein
MPTLEWMPERMRAPIEAAVAAVQSSLSDGLIAVCLIGAAAKPDRDLRANPELLIVAEQLSAETLQVLAKGLVAPLKSGLQIRTVTRAELRGSVDVHALELAQWRDQHLLLAGRDPFAELDIAAAHLRHELERALRTLGHRLRNRLLWCLATEQLRLDALLRESLERLTEVAHHSLRLLGEPLPSDDGALLEAFLRWAGGDSEPVLALRTRLLVEGHAEDPIAELAALTAATEAATAKVDSIAV